jgi:outer membrane protein OmpA-like peptidoglycan-associated protein
MKKNTILLIFVLVSISITAQNKNTSKADKLFDSYEYTQAVNEYLKLVTKEDSDVYVSKQLAECYYNMYNTVEAEKWFRKVIQSQSKQNPDTYYKYAQVLKSNAKYAASDEQMKIFSGMTPNDQRAINFNKNQNYLQELNNKQRLFDVTEISINSVKSDFGAVLYGDALYFVSSRNENNKLYGWNNEPFLDIYKLTYNVNKGSYSLPTPVDELNTKFHEGPVSITKDGNVIYFSSESFNENLFDKDKVKKIKFGQVNIYKANKENGKWGSMTSLPFNSKMFSSGNPSIDSDGKTLYFASNMPGSIGGTDIWKVTINNDGTYGNPENLGNIINTVENENFPFIADNNVLYFSSNGLTGFGGFDIFSVDLNKNEMPNNLGKPVNTEKNDFAFSYNKETNIAFLSSNRSGKDHIYSAVPICKMEILTVVKNAKTKTTLSDARVVILDVKGATLDTQMSNAKGEVSYLVDCNKAYSVKVFKDGFVSKTIPVTKTNDAKVTIEASIEPIEVVVTETEIILKPIYFEFNKSNITSQGAAELDKLVYVMSQNDKLIIFAKSHTDSRGTDEYNLKLSERRAEATVQYIVSKGISADRISGKGFGESEPKVNCTADCTFAEHAINRRSEFLIIEK